MTGEEKQINQRDLQTEGSGLEVGRRTDRGRGGVNDGGSETVHGECFLHLLCRFSCWSFSFLLSSAPVYVLHGKNSTHRCACARVIMGCLHFVLYTSLLPFCVYL